jgi:hypothetical protein
MNDSDDGLRSAFQRWRSQETEAAPPFPGIPKPRALRTVQRRFPLPTSLAAAAALIVLLLTHLQRPQLTLAEALPRPLLSLAEGNSAFLSSIPDPNTFFGSDFLQPTRNHSPQPLF